MLGTIAHIDCVSSLKRELLEYGWSVLAQILHILLAQLNDQPYLVFDIVMYENWTFWVPLS